jgi:hypothetical protein
MHDPRRRQPFLLADALPLAPLQIAARAHQPLERLAEMRRMQKHRAHAPRHHMLLHQRRLLVRHFVVRQMAPPHQHIGRRKRFLGDPVVRAVELDYLHRRDAGFPRQCLRDLVAHPLGVDRAHRGIALLMNAFIPNRHAQVRCHGYS